MKKRKIWASLSTAVLVSGPVGSAPVRALQAPPAPAVRAGGPVQLVQHTRQGGVALALTASSAGDEGGEGGEGGESGAEGQSARLPVPLRLYRGIELIRGHLLAGGELVDQGRWHDALPHFLAPGEDIYGSLRGDLKASNIAPFQAALTDLAQAVKAKNKGAYARARTALDNHLTAVEKTVRATETNGLPFTLETALGVLEQAADAYGAAFRTGRLADVVAYQTARGFVLEADRLVRTVLDAGAGSDAAKAIRASLDDLKEALPSVPPPEQAVKTKGQFLSSVARFELQLGNFR